MLDRCEKAAPARAAIWLVPAGVGLGVLLLAGGAAWLLKPAPPDPTPAVRTAGFVPAEAARPAPALDLRDAADGKPVALADLRGKLVLLNFWGTGCAHCIKELPQLDEIARQCDGLTVLCVCADEEDAGVVEETARRHTKHLPVLIDPRGLTRLRYDVQSLPAAVLIGPDGRILGRSEGAHDWSGPALRELVAACGVRE